jgi:hypothetical protein
MLQYNETATRLRAPVTGQDRDGNDIYDWAHADQLVMTGLVITPTGTSEADNSGLFRDQVISGYRVRSRPGTDWDVLSTDRISWNGMVWDVVGMPVRRKHPVLSGRVYNVVFDFQRAVG